MGRLHAVAVNIPVTIEMLKPLPVTFVAIDAMDWCVFRTFKEDILPMA